MSAAVMVVVLHGAVIAMVIFSRANLPADRAPGLIAFDIAPGDAHDPHPQAVHPARPRPDHPRIVEPQADVPAPMLDISRVDLMQILPDALPIGAGSAQALPATIGSGCDLTPQVQDALRHSDEIVRRLPDIPTGGRSIANAIVVWNADWIAPGAGPAQTELAAIRQTIAQLVAASSADCRNQLQAGPRLVYLPDNSGKTTVLAIGSGQWTWQQLTAGAIFPSTATGPTPITPLPTPQLAALPSALSPARAPNSGASAQTLQLNALLASLIGKRSPARTAYYP